MGFLALLTLPAYNMTFDLHALAVVRVEQERSRLYAVQSGQPRDCAAGHAARDVLRRHDPAAYYVYSLKQGTGRTLDRPFMHGILSGRFSAFCSASYRYASAGTQGRDMDRRRHGSGPRADLAQCVQGLSGSPPRSRLPAVCAVIFMAFVLFVDLDSYKMASGIFRTGNLMSLGKTGELFISTGWKDGNDKRDQDKGPNQHKHERQARCLQ